MDLGVKKNTSESTGSSFLSNRPLTVPEWN